MPLTHKAKETAKKIEKEKVAKEAADKKIEIEKVAKEAAYKEIEMEKEV